ncbi:acetyl-CoA carboxylase carboxyl transferase subunit beta [Spongiactinospora gelatinilytica]|uniref:Multifunctional fusion protein n=1 Tax=Spongiactinospora gelatinilytica TaxID=2666298 RepID=A0A2W2GTX9_9ACTN|nr:acetyl-CoA carboxylase carboxyltransferase subunit alpha [Spongiactinospora gelatinilytica]PZG51382.1 acetyl-CoA carboxylase carboxyl transferase subunit beta [Spongiactinospora gelatinilytica]
MTVTVESTWLICPGCADLVFRPKYERAQRVCPGCGHHARLTARQRLDGLLDLGSQKPVETALAADDPLGFTDTRPYRERLAAAREATGMREAALCASGTIESHPVVVACLDFSFVGGSLGSGVGELVAVAAEKALSERVPLLIVTASGGARMQEGALSLMQMAKCSQALAKLDEAGILTVALITDPTYGGVAASFATLPDVLIAEPGAHLGFAGPRVIAQTIRQELPAGFQTAEFLLARGLIDAVVPRPALRRTLARLLAAARPDAPTMGEDAAAQGDWLVRDPAALPRRAAWDAVRLAREAARPTTLDYAGMILEDFIELRGDRAGKDCPAVVGGIGRLRGRGVMLIGHQKGHDTAERVRRNFGMPTPAGYRKAMRLMRLAAKLGLPVVTLVDTPGAYPGIEAEEEGQAWAIAESQRLMSGLPVPVVTVITGEGGSGGALALAVSDRVLALSNAVYSVISPEGCAAILWKDAAAAPQAAEALRLSAPELLRQGIVDAVITEPGDGAHTAPARTAELIQTAVRRACDDLATLPPTELVERRRRRFRSYGSPSSEETRWPITAT